MCNSVQDHIAVLDGEDRAPIALA